MVIKKGDKVKIISGPLDKIGKVGTVKFVAVNGVMIQFENGSGTVVKFEHIELLK